MFRWGLAFCAPFTLVLIAALLGFEPRFGTVLGLNEARSGSLVAMGAMLLLPVAFVLNILPPARALSIGAGPAAHRANLLLALIVLLAILILVGGFIVDQYPCWIGVPNCD